MPKVIDIEIFPIAQTQVNPLIVQKWLEYIGVDIDKWQAPSNISDPALLIALAAKRCYMSFEVGLNPNVTKIRKDYTEYFDNLLRSKHGSVYEHAVYSFAIEGVSRVFTAEMNRHRAGWAISEGSLRFIRFDKDIPYWLPTSLHDNPSDNSDLKLRKEKTRSIFETMFTLTETMYTDLLQIWDMDESDKNFSYKKKVTSCLRRIVPMGVATGGVWTGNIRALRHVISMRCSAAAEEEIFHVFRRISDYMMKLEPLLFSDMQYCEDGSVLVDNWKI